MVSLIERFYDITSGSILIDGKDITDYAPQWCISKLLFDQFIDRLGCVVRCVWSLKNRHSLPLLSEKTLRLEPDLRFLRTTLLKLLKAQTLITSFPSSQRCVSCV